MKKILAALLISSCLFQAQAKAGVLILGGGLYIANQYDQSDLRARNRWVITGAVGFAVSMGIGVTLAVLQFVPGTVPFFVLGEETLNPNNLESVLTEKYPFISDREILRSLAEEIVNAQDKFAYDGQGKKFVQVSEDKLHSILVMSDISDNERQQVIKDLK